MVTFKEGPSKARLMSSLLNLKYADAQYKNMLVQHDLTSAEREGKASAQNKGTYS